MTTVAACLGKPTTVEELKQRFLSALQITASAYDSQKWVKESNLTEDYADKITRMIQRNEVIKATLNNA